MSVGVRDGGSQSYVYFHRCPDESLLLSATPQNPPHHHLFPKTLIVGVWRWQIVRLVVIRAPIEGGGGTAAVLWLLDYRPPYIHPHSTHLMIVMIVMIVMVPHCKPGSLGLPQSVRDKGRSQKNKPGATLRRTCFKTSGKHFPFPAQLKYLASFIFVVHLLLARKALC